MKAKIKINGKYVEIENIKRADGIRKYTGLMFRKNSPALLFELGKGRKAIHSFFCMPFIAVWILENKVQEYKIVDKWDFYIAPEKEFDKLIEIPLNDRYSHLIENFVVKKEAGK